MLFHVSQLDQLYCRFSIHREKVKIIKYLPNTKCFLSVCIEGLLSFWQIGEDRKVNKMKSLRVPADKKVSKVHVVSKAYHRHKENVPSDRIMVIFKSGETELFDFELDSDVILAEGEDPNGTHAHIYLVENEK